MDVDTALLRAFVSVCRTRHFGASAVELSISQQGLSKRIARLESTLGVRLLDRNRRGVFLTSAGVDLLDPAREIVDLFDAATSGLGGRHGLTVDVLDEHLSILPAIRSLTGIGHLSVVMRVDSGTAAQSLITGRADVSFGRPGPSTPLLPGIRGRPVLAEQICLLVPDGSPLNRDGVTVSTLHGVPLWFPTVGAPAEWIELLSEWIGDFDLTVDTRGSTFGFQHWISLVAAGTAPPSLIGSAMALPPGFPVVTVPILDPAPIFWWWAFWPGRIPLPDVERLLAGVTDALRTEPNPTITDRAVTSGQVWIPAADRAALVG